MEVFGEKKLRHTQGLVLVSEMKAISRLCSSIGSLRILILL